MGFSNNKILSGLILIAVSIGLGACSAKVEDTSGSNGSFTAPLAAGDWRQTCGPITGPGGGNTEWTHTMTFSDSQNTITIVSKSESALLSPSISNGTNTVSVSDLVAAKDTATKCVMRQFSNGTIIDNKYTFSTKLAFCIESDQVVVRHQATVNNVLGAVSSLAHCQHTLN